MKPLILTLLVLSAALGSASDGSALEHGAFDTPTMKEIGVEPAPANNFVVYARAHATVCTNATDGSVSDIISHNLCADGWGPSWEIASYWAVLSLSGQTCLGPQWGCCQYVVDQDFNNCGK